MEGKGPFAIRYPRGRGVMPEWKTPFAELEIGKGRMIRAGKDAVLITIGHPGNEAVKACKKLWEQGVDTAHYDIRFLKPIDMPLLHDIFKKFNRIVTVEDGAITGGLGSAVIEFMADNGYTAKIKRLGIPDRFVEQGTLGELYEECGSYACEITGRHPASGEFLISVKVFS